MNSTFLQPALFNKLVHTINKAYKPAKESNVPNKKLEIMRSKFKFISTFETKGVQGITGLLEHRDTSEQFVFKLSVEVDRAIEHENLVTLQLNKLRDFCPNFVGNLGCIELPISRTYIYANMSEDTDDESSDESDSSRSSGSSESSESSDSSDSSEDSEDEIDKSECKLFMEDREFLPTSIIFLEYVSPHSFDDYCKRADKSLINSLILGVLCGLSIAQKHLKFTHYDLHVDNILIKECEPEAVFVYKINGDSFVVPTFGFFPVIIDMGLSYCKEIEKGPTRTPIEFYNKGLQSVVFDKFNDIHHFLLSALYDIEYDEEEFYYLSTKILYFFRYLPVFRKTGWKTLPNDVLSLTMRHLVKACRGLPTMIKEEGEKKYKSKIDELRQKKIEKRNREMGIADEEKYKKQLGLYDFSVWVDLDKDLLQILSLGIPLPWNKELISEIKERFSEFVDDNTSLLDAAIGWTFITLIREFQKLYELDTFKDVNDLFFVIRELSTIVYENWNIITRDISKDTSKKLFNDYKRKLIPDFRDSMYKIDWINTIVSCKYALNILGLLYHTYLQDNVSLINDLYENKVPLKDINDLIKFYIKNVAIRPKYSKDTILYVWDSDNKSNERVLLKDKLSLKEIEELDNMTPTMSSKKIIKLIQK